MNDNVRKMARAIMDNPSATGRQLAEALGYSEPKSIYYWLKKDGLSGVRDLRRKVFRGELGDQPFQAREPSPAPEAGRLPLAVSLTAAGEPVFGGGEWTYPTDSGRRFAIALKPEGWMVGRAERVVAVVDPAAPVRPGDLVLTADPEGQPQIWRTANAGQVRVLVNLADPARVQPWPHGASGQVTRPAGRVVQIVV